MRGVNHERGVSHKPQHAELKHATHHFYLRHVWGQNAILYARDSCLVAVEDFCKGALRKSTTKPSFPHSGTDEELCVGKRALRAFYFAGSQAFLPHFMQNSIITTILFN